MTTTPSTPPLPPEKKVRLSLRDLFIIVIALVAAILAEELLRRTGIPFGQAVVAGAGAFVGTFYFLEKIVE